MSDATVIAFPCPNCDDSTTVCSKHTDHPWAGSSDREDACDHGGGVPCPICSDRMERALSKQGEGS